MIKRLRLWKSSTFEQQRENRTSCEMYTPYDGELGILPLWQKSHDFAKDRTSTGK